MTAASVGPSTGDSPTLQWKKSSYSSNDGPECVEAAATTGVVHLRDSKDVTRPGFTVSRAGWTAFTTYAANQASVNQH